MDIGEGYLDEKFSELRRAQLAAAAATIYAALLDGVDAARPVDVAGQIEGLKARAAQDAVDLYFKV